MVRVEGFRVSHVGLHLTGDRSRGSENSQTPLILSTHSFVRSICRSVRPNHLEKAMQIWNSTPTRQRTQKVPDRLDPRTPQNVHLRPRSVGRGSLCWSSKGSKSRPVTNESLGFEAAHCREQSRHTCNMLELDTYMHTYMRDRGA